MLDMNKTTASRIIDAIAIAIDGKLASSKTFQLGPFDELRDFAAWGQDHNDSNNDTSRTDALTVAYLVMSGGRIPLEGIKLRDGYFRPDKWIVGALVKKGRALVDDERREVVFTQEGWEWIADVLGGLRK